MSWPLERRRSHWRTGLVVCPVSAKLSADVCPRLAVFVARGVALRGALVSDCANGTGCASKRNLVL